MDKCRVGLLLEFGNRYDDHYGLMKYRWLNIEMHHHGCAFIKDILVYQQANNTRVN